MNNSFWPSWKENKLFSVLLSLVLAFLIGWLISAARNNNKEFSYIGQSEERAETIIVTGEGEAVAVPDIAVVTLGLLSEAKEVAEAQEKNTETMNQLVADLKALDIDKKDIKTTNYQINPKYNWTQDRGQVLQGYEVSQQATVKVRDTAKAGKVLGLASKLGLNQASGLQFTVDQPEAYQDKARTQAIVEAKAKAKALAQDLGVKLGRIVSFSESGPVQPYRYNMAYDMMKTEAVSAPEPQIEAGSEEIKVTVTIGYEIE